MSSLRDAIVATLAYHDVFDYPLTGFEVWQNLINPARLERNPAAINKISIAEILSGLDELVHAGKVGQQYGFYFLQGKEAIVARRLERQKISAQKWKKLLRRARWFRMIPSVRAMFVSGSMAMDNAGQEGDFDIFIIAQAGRLYTTRVFVSIFAWLMHSLRVKTDQSAPNKFCFNHYVTTAGLELSAQSIYTAQAMASLIPLFVRNGADRDFWSRNRWINRYFYNFIPPISGRQISSSSSSYSLGDKLEKFLKYFQQKRIWRNPAEFRQDGRIVASDIQLEFHPHSFERVVLDKYNETLKQLGFGLIAPEQDSGLA